jgi:glycosyltransferase involved in cell wall biosynthesis/ubiquinone/menaquinone biosynthesis C-methylase UbiE
MKILVFGSDPAILNEASSVTQRAMDVSVGIDKYLVIVPNFITVIKEHQPNLLAYGVSSNSKLAAIVKIYLLADQLLKKENFDLITAPDAYFLAVAGWLLAKKHKLKLEIQIHGFEKLAGARKLVAKFVLPKADAVRVVSQRLKRRMVKEFKVDDSRITVVPVFSPPYNGGDNQSVAERYPDKFVFLTVSRLVAIKNIPLQIEAMAEVVKDFPSAELWIAGDGPEKDKLAEQINNLNLSESVKFLGYKNRDELDVLYQQADAFMLTSFAEGWPIVAMEAARYGLPIIMTDVGSAGELLLDNESGLIIPVDDRQALIANMKALILDSELRKKIGLGGLQAVNAMPDKEEIIRLYHLGWQRALVAGKGADWLLDDQTKFGALREANVNKYAHSQERLKFSTQPGKLAKLELFRELCPKLFNQDDKILDIGGGGGIWTDVIRAEKISANIYAVDISEAILRERNKLDIVQVGDMEQLPYTDGFFDVALFSAALHHVKNTASALAEAKRVIKSGGQIVLWEPISLKLLLTKQSIKSTSDGVEFAFSLPYLLKNIKALNLKIEFIYFNGFLARLLPRSRRSLKVLRTFFAAEKLINQIPLINFVCGSLGNNVIIVAKK